MSRNRIIYQSEALYCGPDKPAGGYVDETGANGPIQLQRVQNANYSFEITRQDVNQFGNLAAIDRVILDQPTVSLDFSYYVNNFFNEDKLGFDVNADGTAIASLTSSISDLLDKTADERNYYIRTVAEGKDAATYSDQTDANNSVIALGNGFLASYSTEGSVGDFPTASVTVEALNMTFDHGAGAVDAELPLPAVDPKTGDKLTNKFYGLGAAAKTSSTDTTTVLKPGDITLTIPDPDGGVDISDAKLQSYTLSVDFNREPLQRLGNRFAFAREITFPVTVTMSVDALLGDLVTGDLSEVLKSNGDKDYELIVELGKGSSRHIAYILKDAKLDSQEFTSTIGDNKAVTLNFSAQIGSETETEVGLFFSGVYA